MLQLEENNLDNLTEDLTIYIKVPKNAQDHLAISLYHPKLKIPIEVVDLLSKNWAQSD